eukprot:g29943.t1
MVVFRMAQLLSAASLLQGNSEYTYHSLKVAPHWPETLGGPTLLSMAITEAAPHRNEVVDCVVCKPLGFEVGCRAQARTRLSLEKAHSNVGDFQQFLSLNAVRVFHRVRRGKNTEYNLVEDEKYENNQTLGPKSGSLLDLQTYKLGAGVGHLAHQVCSTI